MSGLIVEIKKEDCYVIDKDGIMHKIRRHNKHSVGQIVDFSEKNNIARFKAIPSIVRYSSIAAMIVIAFAVMLFYASHNSPGIPSPEPTVSADAAMYAEVVDIELDPLPLGLPVIKDSNSIVKIVVVLIVITLLILTLFILVKRKVKN